MLNKCCENCCWYEYCDSEDMDDEICDFYDSILEEFESDYLNKDKFMEEWIEYVEDWN